MILHDNATHYSLYAKQSKNIFLFSPEPPNYDQSSGGNRLYEIIKILLSLDYNIYYFVESHSDEKYAQMMRSMGIQFYHGSAYEGVLYDLHRSGITIDHALFCWWHVGERYIPTIKKLYPNAQIIVDSVDVHWVREHRGGIGSQERKNREKAVYDSCDILLMVTDRDLDHVAKECNVSNKDTRILSNIHTEQAVSYQNGHDIIFVGGFNHTPNEQAAIRCYNIFNKFIQETHSDSKLYIVGAQPPQIIKDLHNGDNVIVTGYVQDIKPYYALSRVLLAPITWGSGIKGKICEAVMNKVPVITTAIGAEGFGFDNYKDCIIADSDTEFVAALKVAYDLSDRSIADITNNAYAKVNSITSESNARSVLSNILLPLPHVVVSIVTYNSNERLFKCLCSIKETDYPNFNIVVTDNANSLSTKRLVERFNNIKYVSNVDNEYFIKPNNRIITEYSTSDIVLLNDDTEVLFKNWLSWLNRAAYSAGNICCSGGKALYHNGLLMEAGSCLFNDGTGINIGQKCDPNAPEYNHRSCVGYVSGSMMYMRRDAINKIGLLDEIYYPMYYEDSDWQYRGHILGLNTIYEPKCVYIHHVRSSSKGNGEVWELQNKHKFVHKFVNHDIEIYNNKSRDRHVPIHLRAQSIDKYV